MKNRNTMWLIAAACAAVLMGDSNVLADETIAGNLTVTGDSVVDGDAYVGDELLVNGLSDLMNLTVPGISELRAVTQGAKSQGLPDEVRSLPMIASYTMKNNSAQGAIELITPFDPAGNIMFKIRIHGYAY